AQGDPWAFEKIPRVAPSLLALKRFILEDPVIRPLLQVLLSQDRPLKNPDEDRIWFEALAKVGSELMVSMAREDFARDEKGTVRDVLEAGRDDRTQFFERLKDIEGQGDRRVAVFMNNAGSETALALFFSYLLLRAGFSVTLYPAVFPSINSDVTTDEMYFLIPYVDGILSEVEQEFKAQRQKKMGDYHQAGVEGSKRLAHLYIRPFESDYVDSARMRDSMVEAMNQHAVSLALGELWYGYLVGMVKPSLDPFNTEFDFGWSHDMDGRPLAITRPVLRQTSSVLCCFVHKNARQYLEDRNERAQVRDNERGDFRPWDRLAYREMFFQQFSGNGWYQVRRQFRVNITGVSSLKELFADDARLKDLQKKFKDSYSFYLSIIEDRSRFEVEQVDPERLIKQGIIQWEFRTPLRRGRIILTENPDGFVMEIALAVNFELLARHVAPDVISVRRSEVPDTREKIAALILEQMRSFLTTSPLAQTVTLVNPLREYRSERLVFNDGVLEPQRNIKGEEAPDYYVVDFSVMTPMGMQMFDFLREDEETNRIFAQTTKPFAVLDTAHGSKQEMLVWLSPCFVTRDAKYVRVIVKNPGTEVRLNQFFGVSQASENGQIERFIQEGGNAFVIRWQNGQAVADAKPVEAIKADPLPLDPAQRPVVLSAPIDPHTQAPLRTMFRKYGECAVVYTDLVAIGNLLDMNYQETYWENIEFRRGLPRFDYVTGMATVVQLAFPHNTVGDYLPFARRAPDGNVMYDPMAADPKSKAVHVDWDKTIRMARRVAALARAFGMSAVDINTGSPALIAQKGGAYLNDRAQVKGTLTLKPFSRLTGRESAVLAYAFTIEDPDFLMGGVDAAMKALAARFNLVAESRFNISLEPSEKQEVFAHVQAAIRDFISTHEKEYVVARIVRELKAATMLDVPICVKTRFVHVPEQKDKVLERRAMIKATQDFLKAVMAENPAWIVVHTRTHEEQYSAGTALKGRASLVEIRRALPAHVPFYVNGEFKTVEDVRHFKNTPEGANVAGIMVAIPTLRNPFILADMKMAWLDPAAAIPSRDIELFFTLLKDYIDLCQKAFGGRLNPERVALGLQIFLTAFSDPGLLSEFIFVADQAGFNEALRRCQPVISAAQTALKYMPVKNAEGISFEQKMIQVLDVLKKAVDHISDMAAGQNTGASISAESLVS
ncbi:MAG: tRNA-dihydrouridine synthase, partial [Candidatus Omnitrophica bacterium]|nr:tRNA-dihydrouridine synthase [Candidatus Omnitrophota bacterium]